MKVEPRVTPHTSPLDQIKNQIKALPDSQLTGALEAAGCTSQFLSYEDNQPCPVCGGEDRATYKRNATGGRFFCRQCDKNGGDAIALVRAAQGASFPEAVTFLADHLGIPIPEEKRPGNFESAKQAVVSWEKFSPAPADHPYLQPKKISPHDLRINGKNLVAGMYQHFDGPVTTITQVWPDGTKMHPKGPGKKGAFFSLGDRDRACDHIQVAEGIATAISCYEATGLLTVCCIDSGNMQPVVNKIRGYFENARIVFCGDNDKAGHDAVTKNIHLGDVSIFPSVDGADWNDIHCSEGLALVGDQIRSAIENTPREESPPPAPDHIDQADQIDNDQIIIEQLSILPALEYAKKRKDTAKQMGIGVADLDRAVRAEQKKGTGAVDDQLVENIGASDQAVIGADLANEIEALLNKHVILPDGAARAMVPWIMGTYCFDAFRIWPKLSITSPEKRCGKSTLLEALTGLCNRPLPASNISPSAIYRVIEACKPSLLIDEADTFINGAEELRGVINSGHTRALAFVLRNAGDDHTPTRFSTWAPMVLAMIKTPPDTITERSVVIQLRRRLPGETVSKMPLSFSDDCITTRERLKRWGDDHAEQLGATDPALPPHKNDRALDNWHPLFSIAQHIGGEWPDHISGSFAILEHDDGDDNDSIGPMILGDIRMIFTEGRYLKLHSKELVELLVELEERPWCEWKRGRPMTANSLSIMLRPFGIISKQLKIDGINRNGYEIENFTDAFHRYLPPEFPV